MFKYKTDTELSNEIWGLKEHNKNVDISWEILGIYNSYNTATKQCMLYLNKRISSSATTTKKHFKQTYQNYKQIATNTTWQIITSKTNIKSRIKSTE